MPCLVREKRTPPKHQKGGAAVCPLGEAAPRDPTVVRTRSHVAAHQGGLSRLAVCCASKPAASLAGASGCWCQRRLIAFQVRGMMEKVAVRSRLQYTGSAAITRAEVE